MTSLRDSEQIKASVSLPWGFPEPYFREDACMENEIFERLVSALATDLGPAKPLESGNGVRFVSARRGKATVYHAAVATGNRAEVAFEVASMAKRFGISEGEFRSIVSGWRTRTGREVSPDSQFNWPRVGLSDPAHAESFLHDIARHLQSAV